MTQTKQTNPKDAVGIRKILFSVLPMRVLWRVALAMLEGALKYGRHNYRIAGVRASVYFDAVVARHLTLWWEGEDIDPDSGLSHVDKAIAGLIASDQRLFKTRRVMSTSLGLVSEAGDNSSQVFAA